VSSLSTAERGCLVLADISGYTNLLLSTELEHAEDAVNDLLKRVVESLGPVLTLSKLEGDAAFAYVLAGEFSTSTLLDTIDRAYDAFRHRLRDIEHGTTCPCNACLQLPQLDLKFVVHDGQFVRRADELVGRDVILVHRLLKNSAAETIGSHGYLLLTQACVDVLGLDTEELGLRPHTESYDDVGEVQCWLDDLRARWEAEQERVRVYVPPEDASFESTMTVPLEQEVVWEWMTSPARQCRWKGDEIFQVVGGGRQGAGTTNHCLHGGELTIEEIVDWKPFDYYTVRYEMQLVGPMLVTFELTSENGRTRGAVRGQGFEGELAEAWQQVAPDVIGAFEHAMQALKAALASEVAA
jgi:class 3 adenylate cyclase